MIINNVKGSKKMSSQILKTIVELLKNLFQKPMTVKFPHESIPIPGGYRGEHGFDIDKCRSCGLCANICPNKAIKMVKAPEEYGEKYPRLYPQIDLGKCCFCGLCQDVCPTKAIKLTKNVFLSTFDSKEVIKNPIPKK